MDVVTDVDTHAKFVGLVGKHGLPVICQKPMAPSLETARQMLQQARDAGVPLLIHENFRWQAPLNFRWQVPLRRLKEILDSASPSL